jgi:PhzF family phenazine biosynthesis protein
VGTLLRLAAFTTDPRGGNPAGVWFGDALPPAAEMQRIAADVGYSETAFLAPDGSGLPGRFRVRYFSPLAEVPFCGHATIASGVALADRGLAAPGPRSGDPARLCLTTNGGVVEVSTEPDPDGRIVAALISIATSVEEPDPGLLSEALRLLGWRTTELDPDLPPAVGFAGARHLILAARERSRLATLDYPFEEVRALMLAHQLTTIQLVWRESPDRFRARDPFPVGGVVEDPATGAAAGAFGAYAREVGLVPEAVVLTLHQGEDMGRPGVLTVELREGDKRVRVSGTGTWIA